MKRRIILTFFLGIAVAAYSPIASYAHAQSTSTAQATQQRALKEIDKRLSDLKQVQSTLATTPVLRNERLLVSGSASSAVAQASLDSTVTVSAALKATSKNLITKQINELTTLKQQVSGASAATIQPLATSVDTRFTADRMAVAQGRVVKAMESLSVVYDKLKTTQNALQTRVNEQVVCEDGDDACAASGIASGSPADVAQVKLNDATSYMSSIATTVGSANALLESSVSVLKTLGASGATNVPLTLGAVMSQVRLANSMAVTARDTLKQVIIE